MRASFDWLQANGVIAVPRTPLRDFPIPDGSYVDEIRDAKIVIMNENSQISFQSHGARDYFTRHLSMTLNNESGFETAPICQSVLPARFDKNTPTDSLQEVLTVAMKALPVPGTKTAWDDILAFKEEQRDAQWGFRRFLRDLASKRQSKSEIEDDIEWSLNKCEKEMKKCRLKNSVSFLETYIIPTVQALESLKPSTFLKGLVAIKRRKIELLDSEIGALDRGCAYVFDARKRFGPR